MDGHARAPPALAFARVERRRGNRLRELERRDGVASWRVLAGASASAGSLKPVAQAARTGFETALALPAGTRGPYLAVQALDGAGRVLATSAAVKAGLP